MDRMKLAYKTPQESSTRHPHLPDSSINRHGLRQRFPVGSLNYSSRKKTVDGTYLQTSESEPDEISEIIPRGSRKRRAGDQFDDVSIGPSIHANDDHSDITDVQDDRPSKRQKAGKRAESRSAPRTRTGVPMSTGSPPMKPDMTSMASPTAKLDDIDKNLKKLIDQQKKMQDRIDKSEKRGCANNRKGVEIIDSDQNRSLDEFIRTVTPSEIEELRTFEETERYYQQRFNENPFVKFAVSVATLTRSRNIFEYINNTYTNRVKEIKMGWDGYVLGGPRQIAEAALKTLAFQSTLYSTPAVDANQTNLSSDAAEARLYSERVRSELYKAMLDMRRRRKAIEALREVSRPSPNGGYSQLITIELQTRIDLVLEIAYTASSDWNENRPTAIQVIKYKRGRILLAASVANDILWTKINTLATPKSRMDRKDIFQARSAAINAMARIPTDEIRMNQYSADESSAPISNSLLFTSGNFNPTTHGGLPVYTNPVPLSQFGVTNSGLPISNRL